MNILKAKRQIILLAILLSFSGAMLASGASAEEGKTATVDDRYGLGITIGKAYDPEHIDFYMLSGSALYDHEKISRHSAPEPLRFKVEYGIGAARRDGTRFMTSLNVFALYYLDLLHHGIRPYVEGGIGVIYTDFQVKGQGLRINFNPQMGIGAELETKSGGAYFMTFRLHHISNGGLDHDNRGINSVALMLGRYF